MAGEVHRLRLDKSVTGIRHAPNHGILLAAHSQEHCCSIVSISGGQFGQAQEVDLRAKGAPSWSRMPWPLVERNGCIANTCFGCSVSYDGTYLALVSPDQGFVVHSYPNLSPDAPHGWPGQYATALCLPTHGHVLAAGCVRRVQGRFEAEHEILDVGKREVVAKSRFFGVKSVVSDRIGLMLSARDLQGCTETYLFDIGATYAQFPVKLLTYTRPDGVAISRDGTMYAQLELDENTVIEVLDLFDTSQHFQLQLSGIGDRPFAYMDLDLLAFHPSSHSLFIPGPNGQMREVDIKGRRISDEWQAHDTDITGVSISSCGNYLVTSGSSGDLATWSIPHGPAPFKRDPGSRPTWLGTASPLDQAIIEFRDIELTE